MISIKKKAGQLKDDLRRLEDLAFRRAEHWGPLVRRFWELEERNFREGCSQAGSPNPTPNERSYLQITDCVTKSRFKWFRGPYGFGLKNARTSRFKPLKGRLGFFEV